MDSFPFPDISPELAAVIQTGSRSAALSAIAAACLENPTDTFVHFVPLLPETFSRWKREHPSKVLLALASILPFTPDLSHNALQVLNAILPATDTRLPTVNQVQAQATADVAQLEQILLALFRLIHTDSGAFIRFTNLANLLFCFSHQSLVVRYLAIRVLSLCIGAADAATEAFVNRYIGSCPIPGDWENCSIDYTFLTLWEQRRLDHISKQLDVRNDPQTAFLSSFIASLGEDDISEDVTKVGTALLLRNPASILPEDARIGFVHTETAAGNLERVAETLLSNDAVLLAGLAGSGKSLLINYLADLMGKRRSMITLHLNEQTDSRVLLGMYSSGAQSGTFQWNAGVLTTAVKEGRWLLIEDLDRAPDTVVSMLLPLLERGELPIPSRAETVKAAEGFRLFATMRTNLDAEGNERLPRAEMLGRRFWKQVQVRQLEVPELKHLIVTKFPSLSDHLVTIESLFISISKVYQSKSFISQCTSGTIRPFSITDLLKWCTRLDRLLSSSGPFTEDALDSMFLHAVECFADSLPPTIIRDSVIDAIARGLQIDPQRRDFLIGPRFISVSQPRASGGISVGRTSLQPFSSTISRNQGRQLNLCQHTLRYLEKLCAATVSTEPVLLVGETGIGKTATIQHLSQSAGVSLDVFNMSQQSESGDLLGSFKPVTIPSLLHPLRDEFDDLFTLSFGSNKNQKFAEMLNKAFAKKQWRRVIKLWRSALETFTKSLEQAPSGSTSEDGDKDRPAKKRKPNQNTKKESPFYGRWMTFADSLMSVESRVMQDNSKPVFTFVEGNFIRAVRTGGWVLLDEINLASLDTLEPILDLLGSSSFERRFITLTESGQVTDVEAHPNFRIFAAMNPATDVGKRDLPMSIRTRFTEIYVSSPDSDKESLRSIVGSYIRGANLDRQLSSDVTDLYLEIQGLSKSNRLVDGANERPHFSLRTLTRALLYANDRGTFIPYRHALAEGFEMSFATSLDLDSAGLVMPLVWKFLKIKPATKDTAEALSKVTVDEATNTVVIGSGRLGRGKAPLTEMPEYIITPFVAKNINNLIRAISTRRYPILLQGPTSSGKTSMIEYLAKRSGNHCVRINNHEHTDLQEYLGSYVSQGGERLVFQDGALVRAMREGHWVILDELNLAPSEILEALNRLLDDNRELFIPETQETVRPHPNFVLFATQNPAGLYGGRKHLSRAFRNRFLELHFDDIPVAELSYILHKRAAIPESWSKRIVEVYKKLSIMRQSNRMFESKSFATLRDLFRWAGRPTETIQDLANHGYMLLGERVRNEEEKECVRKTIEECMSKNHARVEIDVEKLYCGDIPELGSGEVTTTQSSIVYTPTMNRLLTLLHHAFANNEPVLLIGETGCGKTTGCQIFAELVKKNLFIVNAHQNTEAGDLLGSQRPIRNRAGLEAELMADVDAALAHLSIGMSAHSETKPSSLVDALAALDTSAGAVESTLPAELKASIDEKRHRLSMLFEWSDGPLVHAMKTGSFFLLDEISLADDAVLERLNSVLESSKYLYLAEKGSALTGDDSDDDDARVHAVPGFQFVATMNPGGDYGKRELSPALRNRFTEIWVPALTSENDILGIVQKHLHQDSQNYASQMVSFASWFGHRFGSSPSASPTSSSSTISIRAMLTWRDFINAHIHLGPVEAIIQGAAMVFVDSIGANPAGLMGGTHEKVDDLRRECLVHLDRLFGCESSAKFFQSIQLDIRDETATIGPFTFPRQVLVKNIDGDSSETAKFNFLSDTTRKNTLRLARALNTSRPILLEGSPGVGKTSLVLALASLLGRPITRMNLSEQTDLMDLFGSDVPSTSGIGRFEWKDAPFLTAMKTGDWVLLDEMNLASQSVLEGLNACLDHRGEVYISELGMTFRKHPDFRVFATQNPHHQGGGRKGLPASFVDRFTVVYADTFTPEDLKVIAASSFSSISKETVDRVVEFTSDLDKLLQTRVIGASGSPWEFNLRDVGRWISLLSAKRAEGMNALELDHLFESVCVRRFRTVSDRLAIRKLFRSAFGAEVPEQATYHDVSPSYYQVGLGALSRSTVLGSQPDGASRLEYLGQADLEALTLALSQAWPVLLVGRPGCGKTALITHLASLTGSEVVHLSLNGDTDSTDLIGGYEQVDPSRRAREVLDNLVLAIRTAVVVQIRDRSLDQASHELVSLLNLLVDVSSCDTDSDVMKLCRKWVSPGTVSASFPPEVKDILDSLSGYMSTSTTTVSAQFEWVDGVLVKALQSGHWLVLDHANLCSASVLDRLNSVLEPDGVLTVNEHATDGQSVRTVQPHPNFRIFLTMDPARGELSRPMRNRTLEICLCEGDGVNTAGDAHQSERFRIIGESRMSRFLNFTNGLVDAFKLTVDFDSLVRVLFDHLTLDDASLIDRFGSQLAAGLVNIHPNQQAIVDQVLKLYPAVISDDVYSQSTLSAVRSTRNQPLHPLVNEISVLSRPVEFCFESVAARASAVEMMISLGSSSHLAWPVQYLLSNGYLRQGAHIVSASVLVHQSLPFLIDVLRATLSTGTIDSTLIRLIQDFYFLWYRLVNTCTLRSGQSIPAVNPSLVRIAGSKMAQIIHGAASRSVTIPQEQLADFESAILPLRLSTGLHMPALWAAFRPAVAPTYERLQELVRLEDQADELDRLLSRLMIADETGNIDGVRGRMKQVIELCVCNGNVPVNELVSVIDASLSELRKQCNSAIVIVDDIGQTQNVDPDEPEDNVKNPIFQHAFGAIKKLADLHSALSVPSSAERSTADSRLISSCAMMGRFPIRTDAQAAIQSRRATRMLGTVLSHNSSHSDNSTTGIAADGPVVSLHAIKQIGKISASTTLASFQSVLYELSLFGKASASFVDLFFAREVDLLDQLLVQLFSTVVSSLAEAEADVDDEDGIAAVDTDFVATRKTLLQRVRSDYFTTVGAHVDRVSSSHPVNSVKSRSSAGAWLSLGIGALLLVTPDQPFDPAETHILSRAGLSFHHNTTSQKLSSLRHFLSRFAGQGTSIRTAFYQRQLDILGTPSDSALPFPRPSESSLSMLQLEFSRLLAEIRTLDELVRSGDESSLIEALPSIERNLHSIATRLGQRYRGYDDLTAVVAGFVMCVCTGLRLYQTSPATGPGDNEGDVTSSALVTEVGLIPLLNRPSHSGSFTRIDLPDNVPSPVALIQMLHRAAFVQNTRVGLDRSSASSSIDSVHTIFRLFYNEWKTTLQKEQAEQAAQSSWYSYKGELDNDDEVDAREYASVFPGVTESDDDDNHDVVAAQAPDRAMKTDEWAQNFVEVHQAIFSPSTTADAAESTFARLIDHTGVSVRTSLSSADSAVATCLPPSVPFLLLTSALASARANLSDVPPTRTYNFYTDPHPSEARSLLALSATVRSHFSRINRLFPEHATPRLVLECVAQLDKMPAHFPLQKLLTKAEVLHKTIHEWEQVSSREFSASEHYTRLTGLIIRWRQLELGSWSRLFDFEETSCRNRAARWWFVAFETLVEMTESVLSDSEGQNDASSAVITDAHLEHLVTTLSSFLTNTPLGEFSARLGLLSSFAAHLDARLSSQPSLERVHSALSNILSYYSLYSSAVSDAISKGREKLQTEVNTVIKLATWKDANIDSLRQSARQSHKKLFSVVRRWRGVLGGSVATIVGATPTGDADTPTKSKTSKKQDRSTAQLQSRSVCKDTALAQSQPVTEEALSRAELILSPLPVFSSRPARFMHISKTAALVSSLTRDLAVSPTSELDCDSEPNSESIFLQRYIASLKSTISTLQKETSAAGSSQSDEDKEQIRHLKQQKRKLYAVVLKELKHFGFKTNMSTEQLDRQSSMSIVLATCPPLVRARPASQPSCLSTTSLAAADTPFLQFVHLMPQIRNAIRDHSSDLSHDDVIRSATLLESILLHAVRQRSALARGLEQFDQLAQHMVQSRSLRVLFEQRAQIVKSNALALDCAHTDAFSSHRSAHSRIALAVPFLAWSIKNVRDQGEAGSLDVSAQVAKLTEWKANLSILLDKWIALPGLPTGLSSSQHDSWKQETESALVEFGQYLDSASQTIPALGPVLTQLRDWSCVSSSGVALVVNTGSATGDNNTATTAASDFVQNSFSLVDNLLASIQAVSKDLSSLSGPSEENKSWLVDAEKTIISIVSSLHMPLLADRMSSLLDQLSTLDDSSLSIPAAIIAILTPIFAQYETVCQQALDRLAASFSSLSTLGVFLCKTFVQLTSEGYCTPQDGEAGEAGAGKLESGTGLGDGDGAEDISKQIGDDEDLGDLPDNAEKTDKGDDDDEKDDKGGLDVNDRDVDAEFEDAPADDNDDDDNDKDGDDADDDKELDEDMGEVGEDDMELDEKMWDEPAESDKTQDAKDAKGKQQDELAGNEDEDDGEDGDGEEGQQGEDVMELEQPEDADEDEESMAKKGEERGLELPEDLNFDETGEADEDELDMKDEMDVDEQEQEEGDDQEMADGDEPEGDAKEQVEETSKEDGEENGNDDDDGPEVDEDAGDPLAPDMNEEQPEGETEDHVMDDKPEDTNSAERQADDPNEADSNEVAQTETQQDSDPNAETTETAVAQNSAEQAEDTSAMPSQTEDAGGAENEDGQIRRDAASAEQDKQQQPEDEAAFRKLGDALEKWYNKQVQNRPEPKAEDESEPSGKMDEKEMAKAEFEHLENDEDASDAQALGAADRAEGLDRDKGVTDEDDDEDGDGRAMDADDDEDDTSTKKPDADEDMDVDEGDDANDNAGVGAGENEAATTALDGDLGETGQDLLSEDDDVSESDDEMADDPGNPTTTQTSPSAEDSQSLWAQCESKTRVLSSLLTEQLRLVLEPTVASKMRGDFRTGKRLNIKRIIPYIASDYKRDKIWMRRSVPSKRAYQILLAVDDSKSMAENGSSMLALESVALVGRSLSLLEAGEVSVVGFGTDVFTAHEFGVPFSADAGARVFGRFGFHQDRTDVRKLVDTGISMLHSARERATAAQAELWQLMIVISDGHCEDHDRIRQLVRRAQEERVMIVFVVVDPAASNTSGPSSTQSATTILNLRSASFEPDESGVTRVVWKNYFDTFPFRWYVIVREIEDIPAVLSGALRQWFSEVAGSA